MDDESEPGSFEEVMRDYEELNGWAVIKHQPLRHKVKQAMRRHSDRAFGLQVTPATDNRSRGVRSNVLCVMNSSHHTVENDIARIRISLSLIRAK